MFAKGLCLEKLVWIFLISAFLGDVIETIFCRVVYGVWMSRSSVLYGPFSIVWGLGAVVLTLVLSRIAHRSVGFIFLVGALLGGGYEYLCSVFTEVVFGTKYWDYSWMRFHIDGRTNLLYMIFWGLLSVAWMKGIYPRLDMWIEKMPLRIGRALTVIALAFMIGNIVISSMAVLRYIQRQEGVASVNAIEAMLDRLYEDERIERVWPNMMLIEK